VLLFLFVTELTLANALKLVRLSYINTEDPSREQWKETKITQLNNNKIKRTQLHGTRMQLKLLLPKNNTMLPS
jgi:hypothetical protein